MDNTITRRVIIDWPATDYSRGLIDRRNRRNVQYDDHYHYLLLLSMATICHYSYIHLGHVVLAYHTIRHYYIHTYIHTYILNCVRTPADLSVRAVLCPFAVLDHLGMIARVIYTYLYWYILQTHWACTHLELAVMKPEIAALNNIYIVLSVSRGHLNVWIL
jgi:hypothetical protein